MSDRLKEEFFNQVVLHGKSLDEARRQLIADPENKEIREQIKRFEARFLDSRIPPCPGCSSREYMKKDNEYVFGKRTNQSYQSYPGVYQLIPQYNLDQIKAEPEAYYCDKCQFYAFRRRVIDVDLKNGSPIHHIAGGYLPGSPSGPFAFSPHTQGETITGNTPGVFSATLDDSVSYGLSVNPPIIQSLMSRDGVYLDAIMNPPGGHLACQLNLYTGDMGGGILQTFFNHQLPVITDEVISRLEPTLAFYNAGYQDIDIYLTNEAEAAEDDSIEIQYFFFTLVAGTGAQRSVCIDYDAGLWTVVEGDAYTGSDAYDLGTAEYGRIDQ